jgi:hypothetical protein
MTNFLVSKARRWAGRVVDRKLSITTSIGDRNILNLIYSTIIQIKFFNCFWRFGYRFSHYQRRITTDDRLYQMNHCVSSLWFSCPRFSRVYHARWRVRHLLPKWRLLPKCVIAHVSWRGLHLLPKWRPTLFIKNRGHNFGWVIHLVLSIICGITVTKNLQL